MESLGEGNENESLKPAYLEVIDYILIEMKARFNNENDVLMAVSEVNNINSDDFEYKSLRPLTDIGLILPSEVELNVMKTFLSKETKKPENENISTLKLLFPVKDAFSDTYRLFEACETFGSSTAINECSFSSLARIDTVRRMCMNDQRLRDLSILAFEKKTTY